MRKTRNGAATHASSGSACLDLFALIGSARSVQGQLLHLFDRAYREDVALALRILLWARDCRQGLGERTSFRHLLHWLERKHPATARALIASGKVPEVGRWDDLLGVATPELRSLVASHIGLALAGGQEGPPNRLAAKWMPRRGPVAAWLCKALRVREADWRKTLAQVSDTVEQRLARRRYQDIKYCTVPSVAAARYQRLFAAQDSGRYQSFLAEVAAGRQAMHAGVVFPHTVVRAAQHNDEAATLQWAALPRPAEGSMLVMADVSDSMRRRIGGSGDTQAIDVCIALGLLLAESAPEPFRNQVLTFDTLPRWHAVTGRTLGERATDLAQAAWGGSTDIQKAFGCIMDKAVAARAAGIKFEMPRTLVILSDMEFNIADHKGLTNHAAAARQFAAAGLPMPQLVFWNLAGRAGNVPVRATEQGTVLVSGYSPKIADLVLAGDTALLTPLALMQHAVMGPRYDIPGLTCNGGRHHG